MLRCDGAQQDVQRATERRGFALQSVLDALQQLSLNRPLPKAITVDHGTVFTSKPLDEWAWKYGVILDFIRPGKSTENAFIESYNGRLRDKFLNVNEFASIDDAKRRIENRWQDYNHHRPHNSLGHIGSPPSSRGASISYRRQHHG